MDDWEIKDIINRSIKSKILLEFRYSRPKDLIEEMIQERREFSLEFEAWVYNNGRRAVQMLDCFILGDEKVSKTLAEPLVKVKDNYFEELFFTDRNPILPETRKYMRKLTIHSPFLINNLKLSFQISSEDNAIRTEVRGKEILDFKNDVRYSYW